MRPVGARFNGDCLSDLTSVVRGRSDLAGAGPTVAIDPTATSMRRFCCDAQHGDMRRSDKPARSSKSPSLLRLTDTSCWRRRNKRKLRPPARGSDFWRPGPTTQPVLLWIAMNPGLRWDRPIASEVIAREIAILDVRQERCGDNADDRAAEDVERDDIARAGGGQERCRDHRRRPAGDHRGQLKAN